MGYQKRLIEQRDEGYDEWDKRIEGLIDKVNNLIHIQMTKIIAKSSGNTDYEPVPQGTHMGRCYEVIYLGNIPSEYKGETKFKPKVRLSFELPDETKEFKPGEGLKPCVISTEMTLSLADNAVMLPFLEGWRGKKFTEEEKAGFDIAKLIGVPGLVAVAHETRDGKTYANITSVSPLMKAQICPPQVNPSFIWSVDEFDAEGFKKFSNFIQNKIKSSKEYKELSMGGVPGAASAPPEDDFIKEMNEHVPAEPADDLPF